MKAVVYHGPRQVSVDDVPDARIEKPTHVLVRITSTNICGSDLHMYEGRTDFEPGRIFGHENVGEVIEVGAAVDKVRVGAMISAPSPVSEAVPAPSWLVPLRSAASYPRRSKRRRTTGPGCRRSPGRPYPAIQDPCGHCAVAGGGLARSPDGPLRRVCVAR